MPVDPKSVGQDKQYNDVTDQYDAAYGTYEETPPEDLPEDTKFATGNLPKATDPTPFKIGPMAPGERGPAAAE